MSLGYKLCCQCKYIFYEVLLDPTADKKDTSWVFDKNELSQTITLSTWVIRNHKNWPWMSSFHGRTYRFGPVNLNSTSPPIKYQLSFPHAHICWAPHPSSKNTILLPLSPSTLCTMTPVGFRVSATASRTSGKATTDLDISLCTWDNSFSMFGWSSYHFADFSDISLRRTTAAIFSSRLYLLKV